MTETPDVLELSERLWTGADDPYARHTWQPTQTLTEVADGVAHFSSFANVNAVDTGDGLFFVDTGSQLFAADVHRAIRSWRSDRLHTAVYSHGHVDHVFGVAAFETEAAEHGWPAPVVIAHEALPPRFDRYRRTAGYNGVINQRQFQLPAPHWPKDFRYPDRTYRETLILEVGDLRAELHHARGETDDHTWTWLPDRKVLCSGDLFIWVFPNAGNPQKVQRYPWEWAQALREMATLGAELLLPGHGFPLVGADRIRTAFTETAEALESLVEQSLALMNDGARLDDLLGAVTVPAHLAGRPFLRAIYDEPEFVVHNIWRLYGGWYDGNPAHLKPARYAALACELADLAGGASALATRAEALAAEGGDANLRLAGHLAELAATAAPDDAGVHRARAAVFGARRAAERSTMSKGVFAWAESDSRSRAEAEVE